mmetsp:Transcript_92570/g.169868  ORF Transcript_92570/g.169868 Transcript_92570/m.169868 type:complete len:152 (+) Transcript_92570:88-543(+)
MKVIFLVCASACLQGSLAVKTAVQISASQGGVHFQAQSAGNESETSHKATSDLSREQCQELQKAANADWASVDDGECELTFNDGAATKADPEGEGKAKFETFKKAAVDKKCVTGDGLKLFKKALGGGRYGEPQVKITLQNWDVGECGPHDD